MQCEAKRKVEDRVVGEQSDEVDKACLLRVAICGVIEPSRPSLSFTLTQRWSAIANAATQTRPFALTYAALYCNFPKRPTPPKKHCRCNTLSFQSFPFASTRNRLSSEDPCLLLSGVAQFDSLPPPCSPTLA